MDGPRTNPHSLTHTHHDVSLDPPTRSAEHGHHPPQKHAEGGGEREKGGEGGKRGLEGGTRDAAHTKHAHKSPGFWQKAAMSPQSSPAEQDSRASESLEVAIRHMASAAGMQGVRVSY